MNVLLTLDSNMGADLGPNFNLSADAGLIIPDTATKSELTAGLIVAVNDLATTITVTSLGVCTNSLELAITSLPTTTTTTTELITTTTTTTAIPINWAEQPEVLFYGLYSEISGGQMPNKVTGATDYLTVSGSAGNETYQCPNTSDYIAADTDKIWFKTDGSQRTTTTAELVGYDLQRTPVKYSDSSPYSINAIMILKNGETITGEKLNDLFSDFWLSIWWNDSLNIYGHIKGNRTVQNLFVPETIELTTLKTGLISLWDFDETSGTVVTDSNLAHNGTSVNATVNQVGIIDKAYSFNGTSSYINFGDILKFDYNQPQSWSFWVKPSIATAGIIVCKINNDASGRGYIISFANNYIEFQLFNSQTNFLDAYTLSTIPTNAWSHLVVVYDGSAIAANVKFYINGTLCTTSVAKDTLTATTVGVGLLTIGKNPNGTPYYCKGLYDQTAVWSKALTQTEVSLLYGSGNGLAFINW